MRSLILAFLLIQFPLAVTAAPFPPIALHPENPHYFLFRGVPALLIGSSEHYGSVLNLDFDYVVYLNELKSKGLNITRLFAGPYLEPQGAFKIHDNTLAPAAGRYLCPWARSATPGYANGGNKFDLMQWDAAYFSRLKDFITQAGLRGIVVELALFSSYYGDEQYRLTPLVSANNINGIGTVPYTKALTMDNGNLLAVQDAYVVKMLTELQGYDNVIYEICNEPYESRQASPEWQIHMADAIDKAQSGYPAKYLMTQNVGRASYTVHNANPNVSVFNFHYANGDVPKLNYGLNKVIGFNETGFSGTADAAYRKQAWQFILGGGGLFTNLDYSFTVKTPNGTASIFPDNPGGGSPALRSQFAILKRFVTGLDFVHMTPDNSVVTVQSPMTAQALVKAGEQYAVYLTGGSQIDLALKLPAGSYQAEWLNTKTGDIDKTEMFTHSGGQKSLVSPSYTEGDIALRILHMTSN